MYKMHTHWYHNHHLWIMLIYSLEKPPYSTVVFSWVCADFSAEEHVILFHYPFQTSYTLWFLNMCSLPPKLCPYMIRPLILSMVSWDYNSPSGNAWFITGCSNSIQSFQMISPTPVPQRHTQPVTWFYKTLFLSTTAWVHVMYLNFNERNPQSGLRNKTDEFPEGASYLLNLMPCHACHGVLFPSWGVRDQLELHGAVILPDGSV